jgi:3-hydroxybutyryl-CoA dehydratase
MRATEAGKENQVNGSTISDDNDDLMGYYIEDLSVGMTAVFAKTITEADIVLFAGISGDINPVHLNHEFATETMFEGRIAHGMLTASFISTVIGTKLPGPGAIYLKQSLNFKAPVRAGDTVRARATIREVMPEKRRIVLDTVATAGDTVVLDGEALILVPSRKA